MDDNAIIDLYFAQNEQAIVETDAKYGRYLFTCANNILFADDEAEECVNDTYLKTWESIPPARPSILRAFLAKITRNLSLNRYEQRIARKRGGGETPAILDELSEILSDPDGSFDDAELITLRGLLTDFVDRMKPDARRIFILRYWYCYSVKETARISGSSESKVKMTLSRARSALKAELEKGGIKL